MSSMNLGVFQGFDEYTSSMLLANITAGPRSRDQSRAHQWTIYEFGFEVFVVSLAGLKSLTRLFKVEDLK